MKQGIERQHQHSSNTMSSLYKWAQTVGMQPQHIITPALLALGIALMSGLSLGLLIPLAEGVSQGNFQLISTWPVLNWVLEIPIQFLTLNGLSNRSIFLIIVSVIVSAQLLKQLFSYIISVYISYHNGVWLYRMNSIIFQRYLKFGQQFYDNVSHGAIRTIIDYSREVINLLHKLHYAAIALAKITVQMFILCYISWQLTVIVVCFFPVFYFSVKRISRSIRLISIERSELRKSVGRELFNLLTSIPLIKIYGQEAEMSRRYDYSQQRVKELDFRTRKLDAAIFPLQQTITTIALFGILLVIAFFFLDKSMSQLPTFIVFLIAAERFLPEFSKIGEARSALAEASGPMSEILAVLEDDDKCIVPSGPQIFTSLTKGIELRSLSFHYQSGIPVLHNVSLHVPLGSVTALVGPTGSGKSTIVKLLLRLYDCEKKSIFIDDIDMREYNIDSLHKRIGYVSQDPILFNDTFRANLLFGANEGVGERDIIQATKQASLYSFIKGLPHGFDTIIGDRGIKLSGGERQRLAIARVLLKNVDILLLDEATSALDNQTEKEVQTAIDRALTGRTAIVIAHRLSTIQHADQIVYLKNGSVAEHGTIDELLERKGLFYKQWQSQRI